MKPPHSLLASALVVSALSLASCTDPEANSGEPSGGASKPVVHTVNYPLFYFAQRIAGDLVDLHFLPGEDDGDPAFWAPSDAAVAQLQKADLILLNGATYEKWLGQVSLPGGTQVDTSFEFSPWFISIEEATTHSHGKDGEHSHAGTAFTTWMDMGQAKQHAQAILAEFIKLLPEDKEQLESSAATLFGELDKLDADFKKRGSQIGDQPLMASHPVYQYMARQYGLNIDSVLWEPETVPDAEAMADLQKKLAEHPAKWMIWEGVPAAESVEKLKAIGLQSVVVDPCGNRPEEGDWLSVMRQNVENLAVISGDS